MYNRHLTSHHFFLNLRTKKSNYQLRSLSPLFVKKKKTCIGKLSPPPSPTDLGLFYYLRIIILFFIYFFFLWLIKISRISLTASHFKKKNATCLQKPSLQNIENLSLSFAIKFTCTYRWNCQWFEFIFPLKLYNLQF